MSTIRLRRLQGDFEQLRDYVQRHPRLQLIQAEGEPPERYQLEYQVRSLRLKDEELLVVKSHLVEIALPRDYPRTPPQCRMLTPVFHPNIAPHAICIGDHWSAGEPLTSIVSRIGEMLAYQSYNTKSPLNGEAARWVSENQDRLPLDPVSMLLDERPRIGSPAQRGAAPAGTIPTAIPVARTVETAPRVEPPPRTARPAPPAARPDDDLPLLQPENEVVPRRPAPAPAPAQPANEQRIAIQCPQCQSRLKVPAAAAGNRVRCPKCQAILRVPAGSSS